MAEPLVARLYSADVLLRDGGRVHIRAVGPDDKPRLQELFHSLSDQSIYYRFFTPKRELSPAELDFLTNLDFVQRVALAAAIPCEPQACSEEQVIGVARYAVQGEGRAEVAYAVADAHHGRGIGSALLLHLAVMARAAGLTTFVANVLPENVAAQRAFLAHSGFQPTVSATHGVAHLVFALGAGEHE